MRASLLAIALVLGLAGCGGDSAEPTGTLDDLPSLTPTDGSGSTGATDPTPTRPQRTGISPRDARAARRTFDTWLGAFGGGNGDRACPLQTKRFTAQQVKRLREMDRIEAGASCDQLVTIVGILFEALQIDVGDAEVARGPSTPGEVAFSVRFEKFATLGYAMVKTDAGWRVDEDLTVS